MVVEILISIGSGNGLVPIGQQGITWTNADLFWIGPTLFELDAASFLFI